MRRRLGIGGVIVALLVAAGCGDDGSGGLGPGGDLVGDDGTDVGTDLGGDDSGDVDSDDGDDDGGTEGPELRCENPPPTELGVGGSTDGTVGGGGTAPCYWVDVPEGLDAVTFQTSSVGGDVGVSVAYGFATRIQFPGLGEFWSDEQTGADELITIDNPPPGPYFITVGVVGFGNSADYTLSIGATPATTTEPTGATPPSGRQCEAPATSLDVGGSSGGELTGRDGLPNATHYYCVDFPSGLTTATVTLGDLTDSMEVIVLRPDGRVWRDVGGPDDDAVAVLDEVEPGVHIIDVVISGARTSSYTVAVKRG